MASLDPPSAWNDDERARAGRTTPVAAVEAVVKVLERASPGNQLSKRWHRAARDEAADERCRTYRRFRAAQVIDRYIAACVTFELVVLVVDVNASIRAFGFVFGALRLIEIFAIWSYAVLFERADFERGSERPYSVVAIHRSLLHAVVMLCEVMLCFALVVSFARARMPSIDTSGDAVNYSLRTLTTVGVSHEPTGIMRYVVGIEPLVALLFVALVVARLMAGLPQMGDRMEAQMPMPEQRSAEGSG